MNGKMYRKLEKIIGHYGINNQILDKMQELEQKSDEED